MATTSPPTPLPTYAFKLLTAPLPSSGPLPPYLTALDAADGFVHLSLGFQVPATAALFFSAETELVVVRLKVQSLLLQDDNKSGTEAGVCADTAAAGGGGVYVEWTGDGGRCPHLFGRGLKRDDMDGVRTVKRLEGETWEDVLGGDAWIVGAVDGQ